MKTQTNHLIEMRAKHVAFNRLDLIVVVGMTAILFVIAMLVLALGSTGANARRIACTNNLKSTGIAFRLFATDNGDKNPDSYFTNKTAWPFSLPGTNFVAPHFLAMSNELNNPRILLCPSDRRIPATAWANLSDANISYFVGLDTDATRPSELLAGDRNLTVDGKPVRGGIVKLSRTNQLGFSSEMHNRVGNAALADGSVQNLTFSRLNAQLRSASNSIQHLAIPR
ncbi:MAG: hypothetical protein HY043_18505 [Verrucomicrobia bacterium]|nr:hypothetical protein [Verrucomicrobiota bacterium]